MKKVLFTIFLILLPFYNSAHAVTCVPPNMNPPPKDTTKYLQFYEDSYALCDNKSKDSFHNCPNGTVTEAWDGYLYECTKTGWKKIDISTIKECSGSLDKIEDSYNNNSNLGILASNENAQQDWIIYFDYTQDGVFIGLQKGKYCKFSQEKYDELLDECLYEKKGSFLYWDTESKTTKLCEINQQETITITVKDTNSNALPGVQIIYSDTNHSGVPLTTDSNGSVNLEYNARAQKQIVAFHKDGFTDINKTIYAVRRNPNITMVAITPIIDDENTDDATGTVNTDVNDAPGGDAYESQNENEK